MKTKIRAHFAGVLISAFLVEISDIVYAQVPAGMNYQAIARNALGEILADQNISLRFSITNGQSGAVLYQESHQAESNQFGLVTLIIGAGTETIGDFGDITWDSITPWLEVEMDPDGGSSYIPMGSSRLMSVPYALYAASADQGLDDGDAAGNTPYWDGTAWVVTSSTVFNNGENVGISTNTPLGKLHVRGSENVAQFIVDGVDGQSNINPLVKLRRSNGQDLLWLHSDNPSNVFLGVEAGLNNAGGTDNTGIGAGALRENSTGSLNTAIGLHALYQNTTGSYNTAIGIDALFSNTQGDSNLAIGNFALNKNTGGLNNVSVGISSLNFNSTGSQNTATGTKALQKNTSGVGNTASGFNAMSDNTTGSFRTAVGVNSNSAGPGFSNNTGLGYNAICSASNQVRIGNSEVTSIGGFVAWTNISDARFKRNISENVVGLEFINALRPVTYTMDLHAIDDWWAVKFGKRDPSLALLGYKNEKIIYTGFVAQEVEDAARALGYDFSGVDAPKNESDYYGLRYSTFVVPLVKAVQEQQMQIEELRRENARLHDESTLRYAAQQEQIIFLQAMMEELKAAIEVR